MNAATAPPPQETTTPAAGPQRAATLSLITVVDLGHLRCERCGRETTWSGGFTVPGASVGSESLAAYLHFAEHPCAAPPGR